MAERDDLIARFLERHGWAGAARTTLAADASFRGYCRLMDGERRAVLMDAPPPKEDVRPFVSIARHLSKLGLSAPEVYAEDAGAGLLLLEDLGDATYTRMLAEGADAEQLYACAVDVLIHIHDRAPEAAIPRALPPYDERKLMEEASLLTDWYLPAVMGAEIDDDARRDYAEAWHAPLRQVLAQPRTLVLRDFHVDNLVWLPDREGIRRCGLLDFQDAVAGSPVYDLMSLLEDARREVAPVLTAHMLARYLAAFPDLDHEALGASYAILGAQRHAKVIGIFTRLSHRDGKSRYLHHIPHVWRLLERALAHPALSQVKAWIDAAIPPVNRVVPPPSQPEAAA
ncbi:MAG: aminoglycoside phosphotransferase [Rhodospirillales bacterium CG15_BIG_FIL_POST_REV_8_21_14_020_66_15]|nr:MAG: aminoglycoside phosphotransferase [Rhodospirillales bacterium CG15_BIG_FIL_POST_REV_8_21_14_020_66_15]